MTRQLRDVLNGDVDLLATDLNAPMLEVAGGKFASDEGVRFETADATDLRFDDASFDVVACQFGVMFFPDKQRSYREVCRVLRPGGTYLFSVWDSWAENPFAAVAHDVVSTFFPDDPPGFYRVPFGYHDIEEIAEAVQEAGFEVAQAHGVPARSALGQAHDFATGLVLGNPLHQEVVERGGDPREVIDALKHAIERHLGKELSLRAIVIEARKA